MVAMRGSLTLDVARLAVLSRSHLLGASSSGLGKIRTLRLSNWLAVLSPERLFKRGSASPVRQQWFPGGTVRSCKLRTGRSSEHVATWMFEFLRGGGEV